jgi:peptide/nickel transport system permease protein
MIHEKHISGSIKMKKKKGKKPILSLSANSEEALSGSSQYNETLYVASQWKLIWWKFTRHKAAVISMAILALFYTIAAFCEFFSPYNPDTYTPRNAYALPQRIRFVGENGFSFQPFVYGFRSTTDRTTLRKIYTIDESKVYPVKFFVKGDSYKFWGLWETNVHFIGVESGYIYLLGADRMGRDLFSRILHGGRISLSIGLIGVFLSLILGVMIGGVSGYFGGLIDKLVQRLIEFLRSIPTIPLWMALSAALPPHWPPLRVYFGITIILSLVGWTGLARVVRSKFLSLREEEFVLAAKLIGASRLRIITKHMVPSFLSHIIASVTLSIPNMVIAETSLSFLGIGLRQPVISWGVLLQEAQNVRTIAMTPWLLLPGLFVVITILCFNFMGDGLRDAADPYVR